MSTMQTFYKTLTTSPKHRDDRLEALAAITRATRDQLNTLTGVLSWQQWAPEK
jgi:hypothetical protein